MRRPLKLLVCATLLTACGSDPSATGDDDGPKVDAPTTSNPDSPTPPAGWEKLITRTWHLDVGVHDNYQCRRVMVTEDMWISGFQAQSPNGTHHQVLSISSGSEGDYPCDPGAGLFGGQMLYASGVGTDIMEFPTGYAVHLKAGQFINLNLHLFNASDNAIDGDSGVLVKRLPDGVTPKEVGFMFAGTQNISIPSDNVDHTATGECTTPQWEAFALWPHMHQIANHQKVELIRNNASMVLHDAPYSFTDQQFYPMAALQIQSGDKLRVTCTYRNNTGKTVTFGDKSTDEMCFTGVYTYPAPSNPFQCSAF